MKPAPKNWPRISSALYYRDPLAAIDWLGKAFDFAVRLKVVGDDGALRHSELTYGEGLIMVAGESSPNPALKHARSPQSLAGANTQSLMIYVDDVEAHCARARAAGAKIVSEPRTTDYGPEYWEDRGYQAEDPEGHQWWFYQRLRDAPAS